ncbi:hypothetical protein AAG570_000366 [Ranatra chinensis]|uniref:Uncharacterized protein n=1 Tax=Ranatra chinensis TaxID=642074 RepID=A0ABD0YYZ2_9HEMI
MASKRRNMFYEKQETTEIGKPQRMANCTCDYLQMLKLKMAFKGQNMFHENKKQETTEIGAGLSSVVVSFFMSTYYSVIIAYALFYFFTAFRSDAPWSECTNRWNTPDCWHPPKDHHAASGGLLENVTKFIRPNKSQTPAEEFYE